MPEVDQQRRQARAQRQAHRGDRHDQHEAADEQGQGEVVEGERRGTRHPPRTATSRSVPRPVLVSSFSGDLVSQGESPRRRPSCPLWTSRRRGGRRTRRHRRRGVDGTGLPAEDLRQCRAARPDDRRHGDARRQRHPAHLRRQPHRPGPRAGLRARPGAVLPDGRAPARHGGSPRRAGRQGRPRDRQGRAHAGLATRRRGGAADPQAADPPDAAGLRRRREHLPARPQPPRGVRSSTRCSA